MNIFNELKDIKRLVYHHHYNLNRKKIKIVMVVGIKNESCVYVCIYLSTVSNIHRGVYISQERTCI